MSVLTNQNVKEAVIGLKSLSRFGTVYVGRLRRYHPPSIPSADGTPAPPPSTNHDAPAQSAEAYSPSRAPDGSAFPPRATGPERSRPPRTGHATQFQRDSPVPLVDSADHVRHIVEAILEHNDHRATPQRTRTGRGSHARDASIPPHRQYLLNGAM
ncbi:uncharacterized protein PITG_11879 [Phytophthora infestans T30-4]|uniref:Uncharacterized protein n=1 Tax=Phytophthora infestans (strain T30-4) TaxID=403677 RepID=D0NHG1_PHYIT|nr:uncharacterized protein PITG_11879 [Phytophthora infestans T30-4]EEY58886.1 hypothetical protein PITG_11879 [Phytophthora infestans T30-4]|eukprot:XP_002901359.1 hypothetical protein PITG_11879 [Phytophthora infestans T30-4]